MLASLSDLNEPEQVIDTGLGEHQEFAAVDIDGDGTDDPIQVAPDSQGTIVQRRDPVYLRIADQFALQNLRLQDLQHCAEHAPALSGHRPDVTMGRSPMEQAVTLVTHSKSERIDVRASAPVKQLLQEAARVAHKNVSEFLLDAGIMAANQTLADRSRFALSPQQWDAFQAALDAPVSTKPKLQKLLTEPGLLG